jgi:hypothetical protein
MKRGAFLSLLSILLVAAMAPVRPVTAVEPPYTVHEITHVRPGGPRDVTVYVFLFSLGNEDLVAFHQIKPRAGGGYVNASTRVVMVNPEAQFRVYGGGSGNLPVPCPPVNAPLCGTKTDPDVFLWAVTFRPAASNRYFVVAPTDRAFVFTSSSQWRAGQTALGARVVTSPNATAAGAIANGTRHEAFASATAPGGKYGSGAWAFAPCETDGAVGSATLSSDAAGDPSSNLTCEGDDDWGFVSSYAARQWTLTGPVVGETRWATRLFVMDYPKR